MANCAYLISDNQWSPAWLNEDGQSSYAPECIVAEGGNYILPLFWLAAFRKTDIVTRQVCGGPVNCLLTGKKNALRNLEAAKDLLCGEFSNAVFHWPRWEEMVRGTRGENLKIDASEIWELESAEDAPQLSQALRWFASDDLDDRDALLNLCGLNKDFKTRSLRLGNALVTGNHLYGFVA